MVHFLIKASNLNANFSPGDLELCNILRNLEDY